MTFSTVHQLIQTSDLTIVATSRPTTHHPRWSNTPVSSVHLGRCFCGNLQIRSLRYVICHRPWTTAKLKSERRTRSGAPLLHSTGPASRSSTPPLPKHRDGVRGTVDGGGACASLSVLSHPLARTGIGIFHHRCTMEAFLDGPPPSLAFVMSSLSDRRSPSGALIKAPRVRLPSPTSEAGYMMHEAYNIQSPAPHSH